MEKKRIIIIVIALVATVIACCVAFTLLTAHEPNNEASEVSAVEQSDDDGAYDENSSALDSAGRSTSSVTETVENNTQSSTSNGDANNKPNDYSYLLNDDGVYVPNQSGADSDAYARERYLEGINKDKLKSAAVDVVTKLRNFDSSKFKNNWISQFNSIMDAEWASQNRDKNILYQETRGDWVNACATYSEYQNKTRSVDVNSIFADSAGTSMYPVVIVHVVEESNADYPLAGSEHWKPINLVKASYLVYFTPDARSIFNVKVTEKEVLEKNIYNYPFNEDDWYGEGNYYD